MVLESRLDKAIREYHGLSFSDFRSLELDEKNALISEYMQSGDYKDILIRQKADEIIGLRQDKEHLEMEIDMLKVNIESLCEELHSYCDLWFMKLYIWIKRIELPNCKELMSGRW